MEYSLVETGEHGKNNTSAFHRSVWFSFMLSLVNDHINLMTHCLCIDVRWQIDMTPRVQ